MSWAGHDFVAVLENDTVWSKIKASYSAAQLAALPLEVIKTVGVGLLETWAKQKAGL
jgi:hypothetical protein